MKTLVILCILVVVAQAAPSRRLENVVSASAVSTGGGRATAVASSTGNSASPTSASAVSVAQGSGASANTVSIAKDGADVNAKTTAVSENGAPVTAETFAIGEGKNADINVSTEVRSNAAAIVKQFVQKIDDGIGKAIIIKDIMVVLKSEKGALLYEIVRSCLSGEARIHDLFVSAMDTYITDNGCDTFLKSIEGKVYELIAYIPESDKVFKCLYKPCGDFETSKNCCGSAQMEHEYCACTSDGCLWEHYNFKADPASRFWKCTACGEEYDACHCPL